MHTRGVQEGIMQEAAGAVQECRVQHIPAPLLQQRDVVGADALYRESTSKPWQWLTKSPAGFDAALTYIQEMMHVLATETQHPTGTSKLGN